MKVLDVNLLLYAVNGDSPNHVAARTWLEETLSRDEAIALPWVVILAFLLLPTNYRVFPQPLRPSQAIEVVDGWLAGSCVPALDPGPEHWTLLKALLDEAGAAGNLTMDAHLAAIAAEHGAELASTDADLSRFARVRWVNPLVQTRQ